MERARTKSSSAKTGRAILGARSSAATFILSQSFRLGPLTIRYYALTMVAGIYVGYLIGLWRARRAQIAKNIFEDITFWTVLIAFLCARLYYVFAYNQYYCSQWLEAFKIWHGGLAIYGAVIGGAIALLIMARKHKISFWLLADVAAFAMPIAQAIGRFGNFFNYEAFGAPTNLPWKMYLPLQFRPQGYQQYAYFSPTFAYEALWDVGVFFALILLAKWLGKRKTPSGIIAGTYLILYSIGRYFIEGVRLDSAYIASFRVDQITALLLILCGLAIILVRYAPQNNK